MQYRVFHFPSITVIFLYIFCTCVTLLSCVSFKKEFIAMMAASTWPKVGEKAEQEEALKKAKKEEQVLQLYRYLPVELFLWT